MTHQNNSVLNRSRLKTITLPLGYFVLIATFLILSPSDNVHAFRDQERSFFYEERKDTLVGLARKNYRGRRKGFIFGLGVGIGRTSFTEPLAQYYWRGTQEANWSTERQTRAALVTELKIGHGLNDQFLLYYTSRISWLPLQHFSKDTTVANGAAGAGFMYFPFRKRGLYLVGNIGLARPQNVRVPWTEASAKGPTFYYEPGAALAGGCYTEIGRFYFTKKSGKWRIHQIDGSKYFFDPKYKVP